MFSGHSSRTRKAHASLGQPQPLRFPKLAALCSRCPALFPGSYPRCAQQIGNRIRSHLPQPQLALIVLGWLGCRRAALRACLNFTSWIQGCLYFPKTSLLLRSLKDHAKILVSFIWGLKKKSSICISKGNSSHWQLKCGRVLQLHSPTLHRAIVLLSTSEPTPVTAGLQTTNRFHLRGKASVLGWLQGTAQSLVTRITFHSPSGFLARLWIFNYVPASGPLHWDSLSTKALCPGNCTVDFCSLFKCYPSFSTKTGPFFSLCVFSYSACIKNTLHLLINLLVLLCFTSSGCLVQVQ